MTVDDEIHDNLAEFGDDILDLLDSIDYFGIDGQYDAADTVSSMKTGQAWKEYKQASEKKNSRAWRLVAVLLLPAITTGAKVITSRTSKKSAQDYMNDYIKRDGGRFITGMSHTDQKKLVQFMWRNATKNERPLARDILKKEPGLAYLVDNKGYRLRTIKRTETSRAIHYGTWRKAKDSGFTTKTRWEHKDKRTRPSHRDINGETVDINEPYSNGEMFAGEKDINCRGHDVYGN